MRQTEEDLLLVDPILMVGDQSSLDLRARKLKEVCEPKITSIRVRPLSKLMVKLNRRISKTQQIRSLTPAFIKMRDSSRIYQIFTSKKISTMLVIEFRRVRDSTEVLTKTLEGAILLASNTISSRSLRLRTKILHHCLLLIKAKIDFHSIY